MDKKNILSCLFIIGAATRVYGMNYETGYSAKRAEEKQAEAKQIEGTSEEGCSTKEGTLRWPKNSDIVKGVVCGAAAHIGGLLLVYHEDPYFRSYVDNKSDKAKHYLLQKVVLPVHLKVDEIKDSGFSGKDCLKTVACIAGIYGVKKTGDYFNLWQALKGDFAKTKEAVSICAAYIKEHKAKVTGITAAVLAGLAGLKFWMDLKKHADITLIDQFFLTLTSEQRKYIKHTPALQSLNDIIVADPTSVSRNESFIKQLTKKQKDLLERIVEEYQKNNPHLELIEE